MKRSLAAYLLLPLTLLYLALSAFRRQLYRMGILKTLRVNALVIVVGNVVAGGAGKTPTVIEIVRFFQNRKISVGVLSRGYRRRTSDCIEVNANASTQEVGDEPMLIHRITGAPVFVSAQRSTAAITLLTKYPEVNVIVCDDGLQHYGIFRDIEVCVFDDRGVGNDWLMPSGPLREKWPRQPVFAVGQSNERLLVLHTGENPKFAGFRASRNLSRMLRQNDGTSISIDKFLAANSRPLLAVAGIAQPEIFFDMLRAIGLLVAQTMALPDHSDFLEIPRKGLENFQLICTEKDASKLWEIYPDALAVPLEQHIEPAFFEYLDTCMTALNEAKLLSAHGHQTT